MRKLLLLLFFSVFLSSCYFTPRSVSDFPTQLKTLYFEPEEQFSTLAIQLKALLVSMDTTFIKKDQKTGVTLKLTNDHFSFLRADVVNATLPSTMSFTQTGTISLIDNKTAKTLATQTFSTSEAITLNANQVYTAGSNDLVRQELNHQLISLIYYWLISTNTKNALAHADQPKTTQHASR